MAAAIFFGAASAAESAGPATFGYTKPAVPIVLHNAWIGLHRRGCFVRFAVKGAFVAVTAAAVCYPYPHVLARHLAHVRNPQALIEPDAPQLAPLSAELDERLGEQASPRVVLAAVEQLVEERIVYAFDWDTWGVLDYFPTVSEVIEAGREDCDGKAVLAASLLRRRGIAADLVADGAHVWVWTPYGQTMSPGAVATWRATEEGVRFDGRGLRILPRGAAYGLAVFPLGREVIVLAALWAALLRPRLGWRRGAGCLVLLLAALGLIRVGGQDFRDPVWWLLGAGVVAFIGAGIAARWRTKPPSAPARGGP